MHILDAAGTAAALPYSLLVPAVKQAAIDLSRGAITAPERKVVTIDADSVLLCMPAVAADISVTKLITVHGNNARHGLPAIQGEVIVFDTATGRRLALLDGPTVTARRTAAMTLLGIETLAPQRPASVLLIGTGAQAAAHAQALIEHFNVREFHVAGSSLARAQAFADALRGRHPGVAACAYAAPEQAPQTAIVIALTTSTVPVIPERLPENTLAIGVGAFKRNMAEFPPALLHAREIVVDDAGGARHEAGDLIQAGVDWAGVRALGDILAGNVSRPARTPVFKTVGQAAWDLAAARVSSKFHGVLS
ncbi:delta(1)-pyrroline-2-carboxylate reductase family protein [Pseudoduganella ginsengisoli]|uniref:Delta(1)-pyrroline-2-carboxylate reductase family protein n=1 Tax=Pseudoduganella ginsengisoli TaxID=1462440 RepID=A0A6L6Q900_9BURK|nr:delta(1)-pyrroline-2-carboxylate reductase family protein [Pseudoduganella ginsengisoli]MTW05934.1 delta(1)-pyrroline-2-carboxylate reductase family protein [Pseudoduganella ginsengisoli]